VHQHNERGAATKIVELLQAGQSVAFVSDAGTPAVSDPGALLVQAVLDAGLRVIPIPGPSAAVAALSASGMAEPHFLFFGFLPNKPGARRGALQSLVAHPYTLVFYEAPHRILECVADLQAVFGAERVIVFAREVTKLFENIHRCSMGAALDWLHSNANTSAANSCCWSPALRPPQPAGCRQRAHPRAAGRELPLKQAVQLAVQITGANRNELYLRALQLKNDDGEPHHADA